LQENSHLHPDLQTVRILARRRDGRAAARRKYRQQTHRRVPGGAWLETIHGETEFYQAHSTFQAQIPSSTQCDLIVGALKWRLVDTNIRDSDEKRAFKVGSTYQITQSLPPVILDATLTGNKAMDTQVDDRRKRTTELAARQAVKMARSAHAFVRGNTAQHYDWVQELHAQPPDGPPVWICGDCHVGNLGPIADINGRVEIQIRDLDQTVIGNPAHDLIRLALSLASAARGSNLPGATTARMIEEMVLGYRAGLSALDDESTVPEPASVSTVRRQALGRKWRHLAKERIQDVKPSIPLGKKFWALSDEEKWEIGILLDSPHIKGLILSLNHRSNRAKVKLVDSAYWIKGCSSLGKLRFAALVHISGERKDKFSLVDIKEAVPSAAPSSDVTAMPRHCGERVVQGARALSPHLGDRMASGDLMRRPVVIRELMPEDLKLEMEQFTRSEAVSAARYLSHVVGKAHGRQMTADVRKGWVEELRSRHPADLGAPTWLWNAVVELLVRHEEAYLKHCRGQVRAQA
jgi:uncharacterized protein (DUF2252 family)